MNKEDILSKVDHTLLKPTATSEEISKLCDEAIEFKTASVCIPPSYISYVHNKYPNLNICTVIGFPLGYNSLDTKIFETKKAIEDGTNEIDMVINQGYVKNKQYDLIVKEISELKKVCGNHILKVIIETCNLEEDEKIELCKCVSEGKADYIKTSTGFGSAGASLKDVELFKKYISNDVKIKAAGGIRTKEDLEAYINAGCSRIGCSSAIKALKSND